VPPAAFDRLNNAAHSYALAMVDDDDGKAFRDLLAMNAYETMFLKEVVIFQGDLLQVALRREARTLQRVLLGLGAVGSILAACWRWL
jgi:hypothetical protein